MAEPTKAQVEVVRERSRGRCECMGECGHNHQWEAHQPAVRCRVPHGKRIRRRKTRESCWIYVPQPDGVQWDVPYDHEYGDNEDAKLALIEIEGEHRALCAFCRIEYRRRQERIQRGEEKPDAGPSETPGWESQASRGAGRRPRPKGSSNLVAHRGPIRGSSQ